MLNLKVWTSSLGLTGLISFALCVLWGVVTPEIVHMHTFLETVLPGFQWLSAGSFILGLVESFLWGAYVAVVFVPIHNFLHGRWAAE